MSTNDRGDRKVQRHLGPSNRGPGCCAHDLTGSHIAYRCSRAIVSNRVGARSTALRRAQPVAVEPPIVAPRSCSAADHRFEPHHVLPRRVRSRFQHLYMRSASCHDAGREFHIGGALTRLPALLEGDFHRPQMPAAIGSIAAATGPCSPIRSAMTQLCPVIFSGKIFARRSEFRRRSGHRFTLSRHVFAFSVSTESASGARTLLHIPDDN
jgi:hypothetical protein